MAAARSSHRPLLSLRSRCTSGPQVIAQLARKLCFLPMLGWGLAGTPIPKRVRKEGGGEGGGSYRTRASKLLSSGWSLARSLMFSLSSHGNAMLPMQRQLLCVPLQVPMTIVVGKPIPVPQLESPSPEVVSDYLRRFIEAMQELFEKHKAEAGYPQAQLMVH